MAATAKSTDVYLVDTKTNTKYRQGRFLGKGGFASCYEMLNLTTNQLFACKVAEKSSLMKDKYKNQMFQEICVHRKMSHDHVVKFYSYFEDEKCVYLILELCRRRTLMEMLRRRKALTENEVRYFVRQIAMACLYMHRNKVVHRDLKLNNIFLDEEMDIKVGDFGLATEIQFDGERKKTFCGTPNYIAPEILTKEGHSYEVDVWSLGCIMYTMLFGTPPFETQTLKDTYSKIKKGDYAVPSKIGKPASNLIRKMLRIRPADRPSMQDVLNDEFFTSGFLPPGLPTSCLTMPPRFQEQHVKQIPTAALVKDTKVSQPNGIRPAPKVSPEKRPINKESKPIPNTVVVPSDFYLSDLHKMLASVVTNLKQKGTAMPNETLDPASIPFIWISKWVDYSEKYGFGYALCDNTVGILYNDSTRVVLRADGQKFYYTDKKEYETCHIIRDHPTALSKKVTLLKYFIKYMDKNLVETGSSTTYREKDEFTQVPYLKTWFRTDRAMVFHLTNGTVQINFFNDHTKIILCPHMGALSYIDENKDFFSYRLSFIRHHGASEKLCKRLKYAHVMVQKLVSKDFVNVD